MTTLLYTVQKSHLEHFINVHLLISYIPFRLILGTVIYLQKGTVPIVMAFHSYTQSQQYTMKTQNDYSLPFACFQMQMNVHCLVRKCVKGASVWIQWAATNVTAKVGRITILPSCSAEVRLIHRKIICMFTFIFFII